MDKAACEPTGVGVNGGVNGGIGVPASRGYSKNSHAGSKAAVGVCARSMIFLCLLTTLCFPGFAGDTALEHVQRHVALFTEPPRHVPTPGMPDGPLLGNGDVGVALAGAPEAQRFYVGKNDFWRRDPGDASVLPVGVVGLSVPSMLGATYRQEQDLARAEVRGEFSKNETTLRARSWVDANQNLLVTVLACEGRGALEIGVDQEHSGLGGGGADAKAGLVWFTRKADALPGRAREVGVVTRILAKEIVAGSDGSTGARARAMLRPGETIVLLTSVVSDLDLGAVDLLASAKAMVTGLKMKDVDRISERHRAWWRDYWSRSFISIPDQEIEKRWYGALYVLGSCSRAGKVAPGLWGNWATTDKPNWHGDFHLNYNFQAPYYMAYSANHTDLTAPFYQAIWESVPNGRAMARRHGWKGVHFPVCIGPWGLSPENPDGDWGQRSDAAFAALNFIWQYQYTRDTAFLRTNAYPYLREVGEFWEDYLKLEEGRYVIHNDSIHEGSGADMNPLLSLGLVRALFSNLVAMSETLGLDSDRREKWRDIGARISAFPVYDRGGKRVFRYSEKGTEWVDGNTLGIHHIFPCGAIGLDSDPKLLAVSRDMIDAMARWHDNNGFASWYTACARVGYDPERILANLRKECDRCSYPNLVLNYGGGGIENVAGFLAVNEMLMQSHEGVIRFFPVWPRSLDARFGNLRAVGAFLVSAELRRGEVIGVSIKSEKGGTCTVVNPWADREVRLVRNGRSAGLVAGARFTIPTAPGDVVGLEPSPGSAAGRTKPVERISIRLERKFLNPLRDGQRKARIAVVGIHLDGSEHRLTPAQVTLTARTKDSSGNANVVRISGDEIVAEEGGVATVEAEFIEGGTRLTASAEVVVTPFYRDYHQTLVLKLFMGMEGDPVERLANEPMFRKQHDVLCTFEEALNVIRRTDNLTLGIPKIVYLVGWQKGGHDHGYPAWSEVNPRLKREQDATGLESLRWLIREARRYNTTVSLHLNMVDAYRQSPLWDEYVAKDCFARDEQGNLLVAGIQMKGEEMYNVVYPREWAAGLAQRRIDALIRMIPELTEGHTIHVDVFIAQRENGKPISPWHARPENGGLTPEKYVETQRAIFHYWRDRGFDVTGEGIFWAHPPGEGFTGLQSMSWWYPGDPGYEMRIPERLMARGRTDRGSDGDFRFGSSMHGEEIFKEDKVNLPGFLGMFCRTTLPWYYLSRLERLRFEDQTLTYSDGVVARKEQGRNIIRKGDFVLRDNDDLFVPALWKEPREIVAYSRNGYENRSWRLPEDWRDVKRVDIDRVTSDGLAPVLRGVEIGAAGLTLSCGKDEALSIRPSARGGRRASVVTKSETAVATPPVAATVAVRAEAPSAPYSPMLFGGFIEHFDGQIYGGLFEPGSPLSDKRGFRRDVIAAMKELKLAIVRWPGGCFASGYHWLDGVGGTRKPVPDPVWGVEDPNTFGTDEFVEWCRLVGCEPYICSNAGNGTPEEMRDWVEYCNGRTGTFAAMRAGNKRSQPLDVRYWSIGNENWGGHEIGAKTPEEWGPLVLKSAQLMLSVDPGLHLMAAATPDAGWTLPLLKAAGKHLDYVAIHEYWLPCWGENIMPDYLSCIMRSQGPENTINRVVGLLDQAGYRGRIKIAFDEWNLRGWHHPGFPRKQACDPSDAAAAALVRARDKNAIASQYSMADALFSASFLNSCLRHAEDVGMANIAPIVNTRGPLFVHPKGIVKRTTFHTLAMYANHLEGRVAKAEVDCGQSLTQGKDSIPVLDAVVTVDQARKNWAVVFVNRHPSEPVGCAIKLPGARVEGSHPAIVLSGDSPDAYNDIDHPNRVVPLKTKVSVSNGLVTLGPLSVTIVRFSNK